MSNPANNYLNKHTFGRLAFIGLCLSPWIAYEIHVHEWASVIFGFIAFILGIVLDYFWQRSGPWR